MKRHTWIYMMIMTAALGSMTGCQTASQRGEDALNAAAYAEPVWIRNAEPVEFEGASWFPTDEVENLLDDEVYQAGVYRDIPFFIDRMDVRPFERIYVRFAYHKYRACEKQP